jgi:hypothetical protein
MSNCQLLYPQKPMYLVWLPPAVQGLLHYINPSTMSLAQTNHTHACHLLRLPVNNLLTTFLMEVRRRSLEGHYQL